jgi:hypothetical protein
MFRQAATQEIVLPLQALQHAAMSAAIQLRQLVVPIRAVATAAIPNRQVHVKKIQIVRKKILQIKNN